MSKIRIKVVCHETASQILKKSNTWDGDLYEKYYESSAIAYVDNRLAISIVELMTIERFLMEFKYEHGGSSYSEGDFYDDSFEEQDRTYCISAKTLIRLLNSYNINEYVEVEEELEYSISGKKNSIESELLRIDDCKDNEIKAVIAKWNSMKTLYLEDAILSNRISPVEKVQNIGYPFCWGVKNSSVKIINACISSPQFSEKQYEHLAQENVNDYHINRIFDSIVAIDDSAKFLKQIELLRNFIEKHFPTLDNFLRKIDAEIYWSNLFNCIKKQEFSSISDYVLRLCQCSKNESYIAILINIYNTKNEYYLSLRYNSFWRRHASDIAYIREHMSTDLLLALQIPISKCYKKIYGKDMPQELIEVYWSSTPQAFPEEMWTDDIPF